MEIPSLIFCRRTTGWHTGLRHTRFGRNPRKAAQGILSALRTGRANPTSWKCRNSSLWSFGRWSAGTGIFSNGTSGTGSLTRYGTKPFTDGRCVCLRALMNAWLRKNYKAVGSLPEIQRRRFLLYYEYEFNFYQIAAMEHCTASAIQKSVAIAKEKVKAEIEEISPTVTDTARKRNLFFICVGLAALHTLTFFRGSKSIFKEVNAYVQRKQRHRPKGGKPCRSYRQSTPKRSFMNRLRNHPLWWTALSRQAYRCSAAHRR